MKPNALHTHISRLKSFWSKVSTYATAHKPLSIVVIFVFVALCSFTYGKFTTTASGTQYVFGRVTRGDLTVNVSGSGQVATLSQVSIKPQTTGQTQTLGQIIQVDVKNGDFVKAGQVVAILDGKNALQSLNQAKASVASAQASYDKLVDGPSSTTLASLNNSITSSQNSLDNEKETIVLDLQNSYLSLSNSVYINTDVLFTNPNLVPTSLNSLNLLFQNQQEVNDINNQRPLIGQMLTSWQTEVNSLSVSSDLVSALNDGIANLQQARLYFDDLRTLYALDTITANSSAASTLTNDQNLSVAAENSVQSSITSLTSVLQSYNSDVTSLAESQQSLQLQTAPANQDDITVAQAALTNAQANLATAQQTYDSRIITAPFDGQIGGLNAEIGQIVSSSDSLGTLITSQRVVNVTLNEVDAASVIAGDPVTLTFDALPNLTIQGQVNYIDPLGVVSQGVVSYNVQITMNDQNDQIKTGMTATAEIATQSHQNVLMVPTSAITTVNGQSYVLVPAGSSTGMMHNFASSTFASSSQFAASSTGYQNGDFSSSSFASTTRRMRNGSSTGAYGAGSTTGVQASVVQVLVTTGITSGTETEILSGLNEGQAIVVRKIVTTGSSNTKTAATAATTRSIGGGAAGGATRALTGGSFGGGAALIGAGR